MGRTTFLEDKSVCDTKYLTSKVYIVNSHQWFNIAVDVCYMCI